MNIAFFTNYIYTPHYETELELIQIHLDKGDNVFHFVCDAHLLSCDFNPTHDLLRCAQCIGKRHRGQRLLKNKGNYNEIKISEFHQKGIHRDLKLKFGSISELRDYKFDNFELGDAALSSLVSIAREPEPDLVANGHLLSDILLSADYIYHYFLAELAKFDIDTLYVFNGRFAINRAALRAAQKLNVSCYIHERGNDFKTYELFANVLPHEIVPFTNRTKDFWEHHSNNDSTKIQIAHNFYKDRVSGKEQGWLSFVKEQEAGLLPDNWNDADDNIVIYTSSEDEYVSIGEEWDLGVFISQNAVIVNLMNDPRLSGKKIWVRLHPNMRLMAKDYLERTYATLSGNIGLILPDSPINSYDLMHSASKILTFGSTVGIEATYWGKISILVGPGFYQHFNVTYNPKNYEELVGYILSEDIKPLPQENTLQYGFYLNNFGIPFKFFKPRDLFNGEYLDKNLNNTFYYYLGVSLSSKFGLRNIYRWINKFQYNSVHTKYIKLFFNSKQ